MFKNARLILAMGTMLATPSLADCPTTHHDDDESASWDALADEIETFGALQDTGFSVGGQKVFRLQPDSETGDALLDRLRGMAPRIEALQAEIGSAPTRAVVLLESRTDSFQPSLAFTYCVEESDPSWLEETFSGMSALPNGACMIVMYPERLENSRIADFSLAHEWMHTMQNDAYQHSVDGDAWWREGSADWFAHKVLPATRERDAVIERFFDRQPECELPQLSYDAQVFYFWGERSFDARWVFEQGLEGQDWLVETGRVAQTLPPERWLDWAVAQVDGEVLFPDGRALPAGPEWQPLEVGVACKATITAPALSATFRNVSVTGGGSGPLTIDAGSAQVAIQSDSGEWVRFTGQTTIDPSTASPFRLVAISPSADELSISLSTGEPVDGECVCYAGRWMELETAHRRGPFRYRSEISQVLDTLPGWSITYDTPGPVLTIDASGRLATDDPFTIHAPEATVRYSTWQTYGSWKAEDDVLVFDFEASHVDTDVSSEYMSGFVSNPDGSTGAVGGKWRPICDGDRLTLARWMFTPGDPPSEVREFVRAD